jgi:hypothetical protein
MADHHAWQVVKRVRDLLLAANTAAGQRVYLGAVSAVDPTVGPAIDVNVGGDSAVSPFGVDNTQFVDSVQRVYVDLFASSAEAGEKALDQIYLLRTQVHRALLADYTLGLTFVASVRYQGVEELRDINGGLIVGVQRNVWDVGYRMDYSDPGT